MKRIYCFLMAVRYFIRTGLWVEHVYSDKYENAIIIATDKGFRVAKDYRHDAEERVYPHATLVRSKCIYCGHETLSWMKGGEEIR